MLGTIASAELVRRSAGARVALSGARAWIERAVPSIARAELCAWALDVAIELGDEGAVRGLADAWSRESAVPDATLAATLADRAIALKRPGLAVSIARAEVLRDERAWAQLLLSCCLEASDARIEAERALAAAATLAPSGSPIAARIALERARLAPTAAKGTRAPDPRDARDVLIEAIVGLAAPGLYARVAALDALIDLASGRDSTVARAAVRAAARHADAWGPQLSEIERDRVHSALAAWPHLEERALAQARVVEGRGSVAELARAAAADPIGRALLERARAVLGGGVAGPMVAGGEAAWLGLTWLAALRQGRDEDARSAMRALRARRDAIACAPVWTALSRALASTALRSEAIDLVSRLVSEPAAPPRGYADVAAHLARDVERDARTRDAYLLLMRRAAAGREAGAKERLSNVLVRDAWRAADAGERELAIARLEEAQSLG